ncbi:MAG: exodeoxyribonuclease V subunit gamma, partial [Acetatifactor sp.]|nr:exodeoxyribonuclease V subunit gamma [Acetatifactor sp.]
YLHRQGYIHEVKSAISEFMQYGLSPEDVGKLTEFAAKRGALHHKLKDLGLLYQSFLDYIRGHFITTEETLDLVCRSLCKSRLIPGSVIVFDGFTGFTPIQNRVIQELMRLAGEVVVTITLGEGEKPYELCGEQKLFYLSKKTVHDLSALAVQAGVKRGQDVTIRPEKGHRFDHNPALQSLEQNLFRMNPRPYAEKQEQIRLFEADTPKEEVHQTGLAILSLIRREGLQYRDIAVITGSLEIYGPHVETEFADMGIPCYIDRTRGITLNPMIEYIKSALQLFLQDFSYETVFHYLRSGLAALTLEETDALDNYVRETGIRGRKRWSRLFTRKTGAMGEEEEPLQRINELRQRMMGQLQPLWGEKRAKAVDYVNQLYDFLHDNEVQRQLVEMAADFKASGDLVRAREYEQIYRLVMELLEQIHGLLGEEEITRQEFYDILEAGFGEIQVGTLPQNVDRILVGDMERTRLKQIKVLFFLGVNDGNIPKSASKGGIISDMDREFLKDSQLELAPTPRQQMFIQRLYLYLNLTKPSERLYLSYARMGNDGKSIRPAYLVGVLQRLFPGLEISRPGQEPVLSQVVTPREGMRYLAQGLRDYVEGAMSGPDFFSLYAAYAGQQEQQGRVELLRRAAFLHYQESGLSQAVARALYGMQLENSVSRLETYASCAYRHFLQYGLTLREREEFGFESVDMGNAFHQVLDVFTQRLEESGYTWFDFPQDWAEQAVEEAMEQFAAEYGSSVLYASARSAYGIQRMSRILKRTVQALQSQLQKGSFAPDGHEVSFHMADRLEAVNIALSEHEIMRLRGRIDRVDISESEDKVYVKVIDYKSGNRRFDLAALYYGLQLQLVVYMNAAMEIEARRHPDKEIVPAAMLYYHVTDPMVESQVELSPQEINEQILEQLRMNGVVSGEEDIIERLDREMGDRSHVIPVEKKKDGSYSARSSVMSGQELGVVSAYVSHKVRQIGREI